MKLNGKPYDDFELPSTELAGLRVAWGERRCHFYRSDEALLGLLVPYFRQGLQQGERCLWLAGAAQPSEKARRSIASLADRQHPPEQLEVVEMDDWNPDSDAWSHEEALALEGEAGIARTKALSTYSAAKSSTAEIGAVNVWQRVATADPQAAATILSALMD